MPLHHDALMLLPKDTIAPWAAPYIGVPVVDGGREVATGLDCWGLNYNLWRDLELSVPLFGNLYIGGEGSRAIAARIAVETKRWQQIVPGYELPGDGVLIRWEGRPIHTGVVVRRGQFVHADAEYGSVTAPRYTSFQWRWRVLGFWRHPDARHEP